MLDEPTSGLDPLMQQKFFDLLKEENKKGTTILFSSHVLSEVQKMCERVAIIKEGKIINIERISDLKENNYKNFEVETLSKIDKDYFNINGVTNLLVKDNSVSFLFKGNINLILQKISVIEIANLWIEEPSLEDVFMHYYEKGE
jgi:ABC-2 type transport system ATP-binding protein